MCEPTSAIAAATAIASMGSTYMGMKQRNEAAEAQAEAAAEAAEKDLQLLEERKEQVKEKTNQQIDQRKLQAMREQAQLRVSFGEAGVLGNSPLRQLHTSLIQAGQDIATMEGNEEQQLEQIEAEQEAVAAKARGRKNRAESSITGPLSSSLKIGMSGLQGGLSGWETGKNLVSPKTTYSSSSGGSSKTKTDKT